MNQSIFKGMVYPLPKSIAFTSANGKRGKNTTFSFNFLNSNTFTTPDHVA